MTERTIDGQPALPAPEERPALPPPDNEATATAEQDTPWWKRPMVWLALAMLLVLTLMAAFCSIGGGDKEQGGGGPPIASVSATEARAENWTGQISAVGTVDAILGVDVTTEVAGNVAAIRFTNGGYVRRGQTLVLLDTTTERAERAALIAQRNRARLAYERALRLIERGAVAEAEVEQARAEWQDLAAQVERVSTVIEKKRIDAPFSGRLGIRQVSPGQYIAPGTPIVTLQQLSPIFVNFELPERTFSDVRTGLTVSMTNDAFADRTFEGPITAISSEIGAETRSYLVQATLPNRASALRPGMFADVTIRLPGSRQVVVVPTTAITRNAYGDLVYVVDRLSEKEKRERRRQQEQAEEDSGGFFSGLFGGGSESEGASGSEVKGDASTGGGSGQAEAAEPEFIARAVFVEVGETRGLMTEITKGVRAGMRVVTAGQLKLDDGAPIKVVKRDALDGAKRVPAAP